MLKMSNLHDSITGEVPVKYERVCRAVRPPRTIIAPHVTHFEVISFSYNSSKNTVEAA